MVIGETPEEALANGIVEQAAYDYRTALRKRDDDEIDRLERFFRSEWFYTLCTMDGDYLIKRIREEGKKDDGIKRHKRIVDHYRAV